MGTRVYNDYNFTAHEIRNKMIEQVRLSSTYKDLKKEIHDKALNGETELQMPYKEISNNKELRFILYEILMNDEGFTVWNEPEEGTVAIRWDYISLREIK